MKASETIKAVHSKLAEAKALLDTIEWNKAQCDDSELGRHNSAFEDHLDNAMGRLLTVRDGAKRHEMPTA